MSGSGHWFGAAAAELVLGSAVVASCPFGDVAADVVILARAHGGRRWQSGAIGRQRVMSCRARSELEAAMAAVG
jgi:hypothetical protein